MRAKQIFETIFAVAAIGASSLAFAQAARTPAEQVDYRHAQFRRVGQAFKAVNDGLRAPTPDMTALHNAAAALSQSATDLPTWFPAGSGVGGDRNRAKAEIWTDTAGWNQRVTQFQTSTRALAAATDANAMRAAVRPVGAACAACHSGFRVPD